MSSQNLKEIVVIYHAQCRDGFGAAYAAWTVFGDDATYILVKTQDVPPEGLINKELYIVDYSYSKEILDELVAANKKVVVIDHHETARAAVTNFPDNVFDINHSGAVLAWKYFHPNTEVPKLLLYIEDQDIWKKSMEHTREFTAALGEYTQDFETWHQLNQNLEDRLHFNKFIEHGDIIARFEDSIVEKIVSFKERAVFEGHEIYVVNAERLYRSIVGHHLAEINKHEGRLGLGIVYYRYDGAVHCSLRSTPEVDARELAEKFGGGGHKNAASIRVPSFSDLPFTFLR
jgi:nanoRNase/pAp phosphatase (c-di-AMP/oligoRNAs hydrolase)